MSKSRQAPIPAVRFVSERERVGIAEVDAASQAPIGDRMGSIGQ